MLLPRILFNSPRIKAQELPIHFIKKRTLACQLEFNQTLNEDKPEIINQNIQINAYLNLEKLQLKFENIK